MGESDISDKVRNSQIFKLKYYTHFDRSICQNSLNSKMVKVKNPDYIKRHNFYPFIYDEIKLIKYNGKSGKKKKNRPISYASHFDRTIYQHYNKMLVDKYECYLKENSLCESVIAYRKVVGETLMGNDGKVKTVSKSNIHFAKDAFDFIANSNKCIVFIGDFKGFFDNLDHSLIKKRTKEVLQVKTLSDDWYKVYKSLTKYMTWKKDSLLNINALNRYYDFDSKKHNWVWDGTFDVSSFGKEKAVQVFEREYSHALSHKEFKFIKKMYSKDFKYNYEKLCKKSRIDYFFSNNKNFNDKLKPYEEQEIIQNILNYSSIFINYTNKGIPQGSPLSATLSNVYMKEFDKKVYDYVTKFRGKYMRYSDDFILIIPYDKIGDADKIYLSMIKFIDCIIGSDPGLHIQNEKNKIYNVSSGKTREIKGESLPSYTNNKLSSIDYLGFTFDGVNVSIRNSTIHRYYSRLKKKITGTHIHKDGITKNRNIINKKKLYFNYSIKGRLKKNLPKDVSVSDERKKFGNFISYIERCESVFGSRQKVNTVKKRHMMHIKKKLKGK